MAETALIVAAPAEIEVIPPGDRSIRVIACPHPFRADRIEVAAAAGATLAEIVAQVQPSPLLRRHAVAAIGDQIVERRLWHRVRPKPGATVTIRAVPGPFVAPLAVAAMAAISSAAVSSAVVGATIFGMEITTTMAMVIGGMVGAIVSFVGNMVVNALFPPAKPALPALSGTDDAASKSLSITGARNESRPYGQVPAVLGRHRMVPPYGARPYTEIVAGTEYLRCLFVFGYGPLNFEDLRIGTTPIGSFSDVQYEIRQGYATDTPLTLFNTSVYQEAVSVKLDDGTDFSVRTTQDNAVEIAVDIKFPNGLFCSSKTDGAKHVVYVNFEVQFSPAGQNAWVRATGVPGVTIASGMGAAIYYGYVRLWGVTGGLLQTGIRWPVASGRYDVRVQRVSTEIDRGAFTMGPDESYWTSLKTYRASYPTHMTGLAMVAMVIKATDQLNGLIDQFNAIVTTVAPTWDGSSWGVGDATSNPAALFRKVAQGPANARPLPESRIDFQSLQAWSAFCDQNGFEFNQIIDFKSTVREMLSAIAAAGRAAVTVTDGRWGVIIDQPRETPVQHFTPRNSWGFKAQRTYIERPHAFRVRFINEDNDWQQDECFVYDDGYSAANATKFEGIDFPGVTSYANIYKLARHHIAQGRLRPETYTFSADVEAIVCQRGDLIRVSHDVTLWGMSWGRVTSVQTSGGLVIGYTLDEIITVSDLSKPYAIRFRLADGSSLVKGVSPALGEHRAVAVSYPYFVSQGPAPEIYGAAYGPIPPFNSRITLPQGPLMPPPPYVENIISDETVMVRDGTGRLRARMAIAVGLDGGFRAIVTAIEGQIRRSDAGGAWSALPSIRPDDRMILASDVETGVTYDLRFRSASREGLISAWSTVYQHTVVGLSTPPPDVGRVMAENDILRWQYDFPPVDFAGFRVRHRAGNTRAWDDATPAHGGLITDTTFPLGGLPSGTRTILVKAVDVAGNESVHPAALVVALGDPVVANVLVTEDYRAAGYPGTITGGAVVGTDVLATSSGVFWPADDSGLFWSPDDAARFWQDAYAELVYLVAFVPPQEAVPAQLTVDAAVTGEPWQLEYRTAGDGLFWTGSDAQPFWGADDQLFWEPLGDFATWPGSVTATRQSYEFRVRCASGPVQGRISSFAVSLDVPDMVDRISDLSVAADGSRPTLTKAFRVITNVQITLQYDGGTAVNAYAVDKLPGGPLIQCVNAAGAPTTGSVDLVLQGY